MPLAGEIQEGLQLVVNAQHHHVALGKARQQAVQEGDQQRGQGQIEDGRHADGIQFAVQCGIRAQAAAAQSDRQLSTDVNEKVNAQAQQLADAGGKGRTRNAHAGTGPRPKIRMGSRRMLHTQPKISAAIVTFMRPTA